jgi:hypothetical protein
VPMTAHNLSIPSRSLLSPPSLLHLMAPMRQTPLLSPGTKSCQRRTSIHLGCTPKTPLSGRQGRAPLHAEIYYLQVPGATQPQSWKSVTTAKRCPITNLSTISTRWNYKLCANTVFTREWYLCSSDLPVLIPCDSVF